MIRNLVKPFALAAVALALLAPAASAQDTTNVTVTGGSLAITAAPLVSDFTAVTLNGTAKTTSAALDDFEVNDARGTGAGWNVTVQATQFADPAPAAGTVAKSLPAGSLTMAAPAVAQDGTTSANPTISAGPYTIDNGAAVKIASAAANTGMGKYDFSDGTAAAGIPLTLQIAANTYATTYQSTATITLASAP